MIMAFWPPSAAVQTRHVWLGVGASGLAAAAAVAVEAVCTLLSAAPAFSGLPAAASLALGLGLGLGALSLRSNLAPPPSSAAAGAASAVGVLSSRNGCEAELAPAPADACKPRAARLSSLAALPASMARCANSLPAERSGLAALARLSLWPVASATSSGLGSGLAQNS